MYAVWTPLWSCRISRLKPCCVNFPNMVWGWYPHAWELRPRSVDLTPLGPPRWTAMRFYGHRYASSPQSNALFIFHTTEIANVIDSALGSECLWRNRLCILRHWLLSNRLDRQVAERFHEHVSSSSDLILPSYSCARYQYVARDVSCMAGPGKVLLNPWSKNPEIWQFLSGQILKKFVRTAD